jgi:hypothetical protein
MLIIISLVSLSSSSLSVLRVLSEQTLEINKEVKDSSVPDPSLAKVVKDSTLTILFSSDPFLASFVKRGATIGGFLQRGVHCPIKEGSIWLLGRRS